MFLALSLHNACTTPELAFLDPAYSNLTFTESRLGEGCTTVGAGGVGVTGPAEFFCPGCR